MLNIDFFHAIVYSLIKSERSDRRCVFNLVNQAIVEYYVFCLNGVTMCFYKIKDRQ